MHSQAVALFWAGIFCLSDMATACSRVTYHAGVDDRIVVGRSMDFVADTNTTMWALPAGIRRTGGVPDNPLKWKSKYGSVTAVMYNKVYTEGMNSQGLTASVLYLDGSNYGIRDPSRSGLFIGFWLQYFLDMYATVNEAVADVCKPGKEKFQVVTTSVLPGVNSVGHMGISDKSGNNLIMEYVDGKLKCYNSVNYTVLTNEPTYDKQLAIDSYWEPIATSSLPGSSRPADRFARLSAYNRAIPSSPDLPTAVSLTAGMIRAVSTPIVPESWYTGPAEKDIWPTLWRMYEDSHDMMLFYESAKSPSVFWVDFSGLDLSDKGDIRVLSLINVPWEQRMGNMTTKFTKTTQFI